MNRVTLNTIFACALTLVVGVAAGAMHRVSPGGERRSLPAMGAGEAVQKTNVNEPLARAVKTEMGAKRWLLLVAAAEKATAKDMPGIIRAAGDNYEAVRMLGTHWARLDAKHMFAILYAEYLQPSDAPTALPMRYSLVESLFEEWTRADPAGVVKAISEAPNFFGGNSIRITAINSLMKVDVETALRAMHDWNINNYTPDMDAVTAWAARDPRHASEIAAKYSRGYAATEVLKHIGDAWSGSDPESGLLFAATLPTDSRARLGTEILRGWAEKDLGAAASFTAAQTDSSFRNALAQGLVGPWAKKDPAAALAWSQENLRGSARAEAIGGIVKAAAEKDLVTAGELVAGMDGGTAQNRAAASLFEVWFKKGKDQREAAFEWLAALPDQEARRAAFGEVGGNWLWNDPAGVRDFVTGPHSDLAPSYMVHQIARNEAGKNPEAAMEWAGKLPADRVDEARDQVLSSWMQVRPEGAANYVRKLPAGPERERAILMVTRQLGWQAPAQAAAWILTLPDAEQKTAMESFNGMDPKQRRKIEDAMKTTAK